MEISNIVTALAALAQEHRLAVYRYLVQTGQHGVTAGEIAERFGLPAATLSFHLKTLKHAGLVLCTRDGRSRVYVANYPAMNTLLAYLTENCCAGNLSACALPTCATLSLETAMKEKIYNVLFLCTGNSARSILAESLMNHWGKGRFLAYSAGSHPAGQVNPLAIELLRRLNMPAEGLRSKSWDEFAEKDAPQMDFVFTVCDNAAHETCPVWPGQPITAHWGAPDPAAVEGSDKEKMQAFREAFRILENRVKIFVELPLNKLENLKIKQKLEEIGHILPDGAADGV